MLTIYCRFHAWQSSMLFATMFVCIPIPLNTAYAHMPNRSFTYCSAGQAFSPGFCLLSILLWSASLACMLTEMVSLPRFFTGAAGTAELFVGRKDRSYTYHIILVDTLDHFEVPFFGRLANSFVDDEWIWSFGNCTCWNYYREACLFFIYPCLSILASFFLWFFGRLFVVNDSLCVYLIPGL